MKNFLILLFFPFNLCYAYYLNTNTGAHFDDSDVKVYITSNSDCTNTGFSKEDILDYAITGSEKLWNSVPTANINIKKGGVLNTNDSLYLTGRLCDSSESECSSSVRVPTYKDIVIACNSSTDNFPNSQYLAISAPNDVSGKEIKGSIILINDTEDTIVDGLSKAEMISLMAHEIGHAIGLGHSDKDEALMYYKNSENRDRLSQDDIDGVTYLYPNRLDGCTSILGTIDDTNDETPINKNIFLSFLLGVALFIAYKKLVSRVLQIAS